MQALLSASEDPVHLNGASETTSGRDEGPRTTQSASTAAQSGDAELDAKTKDMLQKLSELSNSLVRDAKEDDEIFRAQHSQSLD